jgi:dynein heavy chain
VSIRQPFDEITIKNDFPFRYEDSMNVVLVQEVSRYNRLLKVIHTSLKACILVLKGQVITTKETEAILDSIFSNKIPEAWQKRAYPSLKPLKSWIENLSDRLAMLE